MSLRICFIYLFAVLSLCSLQAEWLVKNIELLCNDVWNRYEMSYTQSKQLHNVRHFTSADRQDWIYAGNSFFAYDKTGRLVSRFDYEMLSENDSVLRYKKIINNKIPDAVSVSDLYDFVNGVIISEKINFPVADSVVYNTSWQSLSDDKILAQKAVYRYDKFKELDSFDLFYNDGVNIAVGYQCSFNKISPFECHSMVRVLKGGLWEDSLLVKSFYNEHNLISSYILFEIENNCHIPAIKVAYDYDSHLNPKTYTISYWNVVFWSPMFRFVYDYSDVGTLLSMTSQKFLYNKWLSDSYQTVEYNEIGQLYSSVVEAEFWGEEYLSRDFYVKLPQNLSNIFLKAEELYVTYIDEYTTEADSASDFIPIIYPNPSSNGIFRIDNISNGPIDYFIYSASGMLLATGFLTDDILNLSDFMNGIYFAVLSMNNRKFVVKLIIDKN